MKTVFSLSNQTLLLDTHIWFRYQVHSKRLRPAAADLIDAAADNASVFVSAISVWELALLERAGRLNFSGGLETWTTEALAKPGINLLPLSPEIAIESIKLPDPMHKDPSDRILVASARIERITLVTSDKLILAFARHTGLPHLQA